VGQGVGAMLCDAWKDLAGARGAKVLLVDVSDNAQEILPEARLMSAKASATPLRPSNVMVKRCEALLADDSQSAPAGRIPARCPDINGKSLRAPCAGESFRASHSIAPTPAPPRSMDVEHLDMIGALQRGQTRPVNSAASRSNVNHRPQLLAEMSSSSAARRPGFLLRLAIVIAGQFWIAATKDRREHRRVRPQETAATQLWAMPVHCVKHSEQRVGMKASAISHVVTGFPSHPCHPSAKRP